MTKRSGQVIGHVFVFLIGAFVMAAIMLLGWKAVSTLQDQQCGAQEVSFVKDIQDALSSNLARGKTRTIPFTLPCGADEICFVAREVIDDTNHAARGTILGSRPSIGSSIKSGDQANVFLRKDGLYEPVAGFSNAGPIAMDAADEGIVCIEGDAIEITFTGTGQLVRVSKP